MKVETHIAEIETENDQGRSVPAVRVTCSRCDHSTVSYGIGDSSIKRCRALLREECPEDEENFYI